MHGQRQIATTWDRSLRLWQDGYGLACEIDVPATPSGAGLLSTVAAINNMSIGLIIKKSTIFFDDDGQECHDVSVAEIDHVTICDSGAFAGTCCWRSDHPINRMHPDIAAASRRWQLGVIARDRKQTEDRKMLAQYFAKADAAQRRSTGRYKPEPMLIHGMEPLTFARAHGMRF
jgi:Caudovirus prohead serine protease